MSMLFYLVSLTAAFSFGVICTLAALYFADVAIRRRHNLRTEADVDAALRRYEVTQDGAA